MTQPLLDLFGEVIDAVSSAGEPQILLIEDDAFARALAANAFARYGIPILSAATGEEGLRLARRHRPAVVLLDLGLPGMDGHQVCSALREEPATADAVVIFLSSSRDVVDKLEGFRRGAMDYVTKPLVPDELVARVLVHLRARLDTTSSDATAADPADEERARRPPAGEVGDELPPFLQRKLARASEILEERIAAPLALEALAAEVGLSVKRLTKGFRQLHGLSVPEWLKEHRLQEASRLLRTTTLPIGIIADRLGFSSSANLARDFRSRFGCTPRDYRGARE